MSEQPEHPQKKESSRGLEGKWMSLRELSTLGNTWSFLELMDILEWGISPAPSRGEKNNREYFITPDTLPSFLPQEDYERHNAPKELYPSK